MHKKLFCFFISLSIILSGCQNNIQTQDEIDGTVTTSAYLENKGSDTMVNMALFWAEEYQKENSEVSISVTGGGSGTGISALISNTVDIANASRKIKQEEILEANANDVYPKELIVARDAIAVIVNPENPIDRLTLQQISDIYSGKIENWSELGGDDRPIVKLSRETNSGTHVYFLEAVIRLGNSKDKTIFSADTLLLPSSEGIISEVANNPNAIGYDGLGYITSDVKVLAVENSLGDYILPSIDTVNQNIYPISRDLYMYTNGEPTGIIKTYMDWILSEAGQKIVADLGFVPILKGET
ncbi:MAG: phosphate-binding protein [Chloroflexi bacterium HGW-Chloroflexi-8]|nr:MAG: phosphate-binding protein [Chloroflexi bacterium HGW-Chloroflexi-8]